MKSFRIPAVVAAFACCIALATPARAQDQSSAPAKAQDHAPTQKQLDIKAARAERKAIVGQNMDLTLAEAKGFWPLYDQYEAKMDKIEDRHIREVRDFARHYANLTEADAKKKLDETVAIAQDRIDVQKEFIPKFRAVLSQVKTTRFFQIDNKLHALVQCQIAQMVPLARSAGSSESGEL
ncbi:hypothetical protein IMX07_10515 [bacterium]|nr:hypothetical protein [bacterium]